VRLQRCPRIADLTQAFIQPGDSGPDRRHLAVNHADLLGELAHRGIQLAGKSDADTRIRATLGTLAVVDQALERGDDAIERLDLSRPGNSFTNAASSPTSSGRMCR